MVQQLVHMDNLSAAYNHRAVLRNVNLDIYDRDFIGIIGPNGGGKTTLLKVILGLVKPQKGRIVYHFDRSEIGYLPQGNQVDDRFPISVREVVGSGLEKGLKTGIRLDAGKRSRISAVIEQVGLGALKNRSIGELSGGELQRTMLARAIVSAPRMLILDEPDTYVDSRFEMELYRLLRDLNRNMTILLVSHDIGTISPYIKSIACVNGDLHYHTSNEINEEQLKVYNCPIEIITHGPVPHRVMKQHNP
ncbi:MAG: ATP-binding cassette domain-containing protein [Bacteroidetes bacterium]|nr:MAG: ATP-binding cassette domain-containing protein [Bacteroidota bacterium]